MRLPAPPSVGSEPPACPGVRVWPCGIRPLACVSASHFASWRRGAWPVGPWAPDNGGESRAASFPFLVPAGNRVSWAVSERAPGCRTGGDGPGHVLRPSSWPPCLSLSRSDPRCLVSGRKSKAKPNGKKPAAEEKKMYLEPEYARSRITDVGFKELVVLPREIDLNEWLASNSAWGAGSGRASPVAAGRHPTEDSPEPVAGPAVCLGSPTPGPVAVPGRARAGPPVPGSVWSGCVAAGLAVPSSWEGCGLWEGRVDLNSGHRAGLGLRAHSTAACRSPRGGDSVRLAAGSLPGLVLRRHMPSAHDSGQWPASRATALHRDVRLWSAVRASFAWVRRALGRRTVPQWWLLMPGPSLLLQPPRFSTTSTCSTVPSPSSAQERRARRWPCATRESLAAPPQGLLSRVLAAAAPPVPGGTEPRQGRRSVV